MDGNLTLSAIYAVESYAEAVEDVRPLLEAHHRELALYQNEIALDPDWDAYRQASDSGLLRIFTARRCGILIGYALFAVQPRHSHYAHRWAINDILWVAPEHRNFGVGNGLLDFVERDLRRAGPVVVHIETKAQHPELALLLQMRGYGLVGPSYSKRLA